MIRPNNNNSFMNNNINLILPSEQQQRQKKSIFIDCVKLGCMLILYNLLNNVLAYGFYFVTYYIKTKSFSLSKTTIFDYLSNEQSSLITSTAYRMSANITITLFSLLIMLVVAKFLFKVHLSTYLKPNKNGIKQGIIWSPPCFVINMILSITIGFFTSFLSTQGIAIPSTDFSLSSPSKISVIMQILYVIILAPIIEEFIYRGLILGILSKHGSYCAVLLSALCFGLMHGNIPQAVSAFSTGIIYAIIAINCGSIVPTIIIHCFNNLIANYTDLSIAFNIPHLDFIVCIFEIAVALLGFFVLFTKYDFLNTREPNSCLTKNEVTKAVFSNPAIIIYLCSLMYEIASKIILANFS